MGFYDINAFCPYASVCFANSLIITCSLISIACVVVVLARLARYRKSGRRARDAPIARVIRTAVVFMLLMDLCYHLIDVPFTFDWGALPLYLILGKPGMERIRDRAISYLMMQEGLSMMVGWGHCHLAWVTFNWVVKERLLYLSPYLHSLAGLLVLAITTLRISLVRTAGKGGLFASLMIYAVAIGPLGVALTFRWYFLALQRLEELQRATAREAPRADSEAPASDDGKVQVQSHSPPDFSRGRPMRVHYGWLSGASHASRHQRLGRQLLALCVVWPTLWLGANMMGVVQWVTWFQWARHPPPPVGVIRILCNRLYGFADALLLGGLSFAAWRRPSERSDESPPIVGEYKAEESRCTEGQPPRSRPFFAASLPTTCYSSDVGSEGGSMSVVPALP